MKDDLNLQKLKQELKILQQHRDDLQKQIQQRDKEVYDLNQKVICLEFQAGIGKKAGQQDPNLTLLDQMQNQVDLFKQSHKLAIEQHGNLKKCIESLKTNSELEKIRLRLVQKKKLRQVGQSDSDGDKEESDCSDIDQEDNIYLLIKKMQNLIIQMETFFQANYFQSSQSSEILRIAKENNYLINNSAPEIVINREQKQQNKSLLGEISIIKSSGQCGSLDNSMNNDMTLFDSQFKQQQQRSGGESIAHINNSSQQPTAISELQLYQHDTVQKKAQQLRKLEPELFDQKKKIISLEVQNKFLKKQIDKLNQELHQNEAKRKSSIKKEQSQEGDNNIDEELVSQNQDTILQIQKLKEEQSLASKQLETIKIQRDKYQAELSITNQQLKKVEQQSNKNAIQVEEKNKQLIGLKNKIEIIKRKAEQNQKQADSDLKAKSDQMIQLTNQHIVQRERLQAIVKKDPDRNKIHNLESQISQLIKERQKASQQKQKAAQQVEQRTQELVRAKDEVKKLQKKLIKFNHAEKPIVYQQNIPGTNSLYTPKQPKFLSANNNNNHMKRNITSVQDLLNTNSSIANKKKVFFQRDNIIRSVRGGGNARNLFSGFNNMNEGPRSDANPYDKKSNLGFKATITNKSRLSGFDTGVISYNPGKNNKDREKNNTDLIDDDFLSSRTPSGSISKVFSSISEKFM